MSDKKDLVGYYYTKIIKSLRYLEYSYKKISPLSTTIADLTPDQLVEWDGFATRFSRASDVFLSKYLKAAVKNDDPAFDGSFRDLLNRSEKLGIIEKTEVWLEIRELRNVIVHEYSDSDLSAIFQKMKKYTPLLLELEKKLSI